ncbi:MAG TPA: MBL fold metallo-hydrolase, partial [Verrucomicrobiae bacterium]
MRQQIFPSASLGTKALALAVLALILGACGVSSRAADTLTGDILPAEGGDLIIHPVNHASFVMGWNDKIIYVDPVGGGKRFDGLPRPGLILLTHTHGDHLSVETLQSVIGEKTVLVAPPSVAGQLPEKLRGQTIVLTNGESKSAAGIGIEAVPMYNTTPERMQFHPKGSGNGYVVTLGGRRVYVSGDTEDLPEMLALKN